MGEVTDRPEQHVRHGPFVWRSTLRGVLVLGDQAILLEGLGATVWLALDDGPATPSSLVETLADWGMDVDRSALDSAVDRLVGDGLLSR
jgi:hypothetical protein